MYSSFVVAHTLKTHFSVFFLPFVFTSKLFTDFILNVPVGRLTIQKLYCLIEIVHSDLFTQHGKEKSKNL